MPMLEKRDVAFIVTLIMTLPLLLAIRGTGLLSVVSLFSPKVMFPKLVIFTGKSRPNI
jgi:hypothetical protein